MSQRGSSRAAAGILAALMLSGCVSQGLAFRVDDRLSFSSPKDREEVTLPLTVRWDVHDFSVVEPGTSSGLPRGQAGYFAVFVDGTPQPPGKTLAWLARKDRSCRPSDGCPDAEYLAARNIYSTSAKQLTFSQLPRPSDQTKKERHRVTIVFLDPTGKRIGESAFQTEFTVKRKGS